MAEYPASPYSYDQWDEDLVDLSFQSGNYPPSSCPAYPPHSVPDLHHLLTARGSHLDYQLYSQAAILHSMLRKVIPTHLQDQVEDLLYFLSGTELSHCEAS